MSQIEQINQFWINGSATVPAAFKRQMKLWFRSSPSTDEIIRREFSKNLQAAERGELTHWQTTIDGTIALIILFDQFSRNLYRGSAKAYSNDENAQHLALKLIKSGDHLQLSAPEQMVIYQPFHHAENADLQNLAVELVTDLINRSEPAWRDLLENNMRSMRNHRDIIAQFGRFPHRNLIMGRESTPDEILYLSKNDRHYGQK